jgi:flagellar protein FlgJ
MNVFTMAAGPATANADTVALQRHLKLQDAAEKFEGMMLQELLKPMQEGKDGSFGGFGGGFSSGEEDRDDSLDTISSFGTEAVATAIAKAGGVGIAKQVMREVGALDGDRYGDKGGVEVYNGRSRYQNGSLDERAKKKS